MAETPMSSAAVASETPMSSPSAQSSPTVTFGWADSTPSQPIKRRDRRMMTNESSMTVLTNIENLRESCAMNHLASVLSQQFGEDGDSALVVEPTASLAGGSSADGSAAPSKTSQASTAGPTATFLLPGGQSVLRRWGRKLLDNAYVMCFFMALTFYALFATDLDQIFGTKESRYNISIATTVVFVFFFFEMVINTLGMPGYVSGAYFWLDLVALLSLIPDTYFVAVMMSTDAFAAGRATRLTRILRAATRGAKTTRLNRLVRLIRITAMMQRVARLGRRVNTDDSLKLLDKKLRRIFEFMDDDKDGLITLEEGQGCVELLRSRLMGNSRNSHTSRSSKQRPSTVSNQSGVSGTNSLEGAEPTTPMSPTPSSGAMSPTLPDTPGQRPLAATRSMELPFESSATEPAGEFIGSPSNKTRISVSASHGIQAARSLQAQLAGEGINFEEFRELVQKDTRLHKHLLDSCRLQMKTKMNMANFTSRHTEKIGLKVALGVLTLLFVLSLAEGEVKDYSVERGLDQVDAIIQDNNGNFSWYLGEQQVVPVLVQQQVNALARADSRIRVVDGPPRDYLYIDVDSKVLCNEFLAEPIGCPIARGGSVNFTSWYRRESLDQIQEDMEASSFRFQDVLIVTVPNADPDSDSLLGLFKLLWSIVTGDDDNVEEVTTTSVVVMYNRVAVEQEGLISVATTCLVIFVIIGGITVLSKDFRSLTATLLIPLKQLGEEMQSIAQLHLAGVENEKDAAIVNTKVGTGEGTSEIQLIRKTFESMKKAIRSWGKYVPWPVVQTVLADGQDAMNAVEEEEVTMFFSDIAGFTTIVEGLSQEKSLSLLSRYFNDMSRIIDGHGGVVIEFIGDAIVAIYGAPLVNADHPTAGVKATLKMLSALKKLNEWGAPKELPHVSIRCGVHTGTVLVGNMGFRTRIKYGVIGEESHIPAKLEELNKTYKTNMLVSTATYLRLSLGAFVIRPIDYLALRSSNPDDVEVVYEVMDRNSRKMKGIGGHPLMPAAHLHSQAMMRYRERDFENALLDFKEVGRLMQDVTGSEDYASALFVERCEAYLRRPPPPHWNGLFDASLESHNLKF
eukprot:TRINITY_DN20667_c0_g3_i1.p1 TRINITY_DN20667_c0_g3~~TRINITY_DN20667_c0_g3_i1.p1  ORF type:complete len:1077 (+),score=235.23 TRINITY_DN20667_c0_g3_i1:134-3364(+)